MKFEWENNKTASTAIKIAVLLLLVLGIVQVFLIKQLGKNTGNTVIYKQSIEALSKRGQGFFI